MAIKVLVVEDDQSTKLLIEFKLENSGFEVFTAADGTEALAFLQKSMVDVIILDLMMPLMSGNELLIEMKRDDKLKDIPVLILTAKTLEKDIVEGLSLGADDYIKKPFSPSELVARVRAVLARRKQA
jgi:two-component system phosphate regulon response regulator PhoB